MPRATVLPYFDASVGAMSANMLPPDAIILPHPSRLPGLLKWSAGFLALIVLTLQLFGATPDQTTSLGVALGPDVQTARL